MYMRVNELGDLGFSLRKSLKKVTGAVTRVAVPVRLAQKIARPVVGIARRALPVARIALAPVTAGASLAKGSALRKIAVPIARVALAPTTGGLSLAKNRKQALDILRAQAVIGGVTAGVVFGGPQFLKAATTQKFRGICRGLIEAGLGGR